MTKRMTLCIVHEHPRVLLGLKKRGLGSGRFNGFGGKVEEGEEIHHAAKRELEEEAGIQVEEMERMGVLDFEFTDMEPLQVHVYRGCSPQGEPRESEEMRPQWFFIDEIPFGEMWPDDRYWLPLFLKGRKFKGKFVFADENNLLDYHVEVVKDL